MSRRHWWRSSSLPRTTMIVVLFIVRPAVCHGYLAQSTATARNAGADAESSLGEKECLIRDIVIFFRTEGLCVPEYVSISETYRYFFRHLLIVKGQKSIFPFSAASLQHSP
jgi:hypothetical protein